MHSVRNRRILNRPLSRRALPVIVALSTLISVLGWVRPAGAAEEAEDVLALVEGRGWGHGRGMGQWGAQGYALDHGWTSDQILNHFYSNTRKGTIPATLPDGINASALRVEIRSQIAKGLHFNIGIGAMRLTNSAGTELAVIPEGRTGRIRSDGAGGLLLDTAVGCGGPWEEAPVAFAALKQIDIKPTVAPVKPLDPTSSEVLRICHLDGSSTWYEGFLRAVSHPQETNPSTAGDDLHTINIVSVEEYLRGVVPKEVPASWDEDALRAQAVAARSYVLAGDPRQQPYADSCDTTRCQVYGGRYRFTASKGFEASFHARTDAAILATQGVIRLFTSNGAVARTEFSASTGGYTIDAVALGGFPAVVDAGDATAKNPHRAWEKLVNLTSWVAAQKKGALLSIDEIERTGNGPDGGHVVRVRFTFANGTVTLTGEQARTTFGLKSPWFTFGPVGAELIEANALYVDALFELFLRRVPSATERSERSVALHQGASRYSVTAALAFSSEWAGVKIDELYQAVFGRKADAVGRAYWLDQMARGRRFERVAADFYGSPEFYAKSGSTTRGFVTALYGEIQDRSPDAGGLAFWTDQIDRKKIGRGSVAAAFYASIESRTKRVAGLYQQILGRNPDAGGLAFWADGLLRRDDVQLAAELAASEEFFVRAQG